MIAQNNFLRIPLKFGDLMYGKDNLRTHPKVQHYREESLNLKPLLETLER